jgi:hypothetical protein
MLAFFQQQVCRMADRPVLQRCIGCNYLNARYFFPTDGRAETAPGDDPLASGHAPVMHPRRIALNL